MRQLTMMSLCIVFLSGCMETWEQEPIEPTESSALGDKELYSEDVAGSRDGIDLTLDSAERATYRFRFDCTSSEGCSGTIGVCLTRILPDICCETEECTDASWDAFMRGEEPEGFCGADVHFSILHEVAPEEASHVDFEQEFRLIVPRDNERYDECWEVDLPGSFIVGEFEGDVIPEGSYAVEVSIGTVGLYSSRTIVEAEIFIDIS